MKPSVTGLARVVLFGTLWIGGVTSAQEPFRGFFTYGGAHVTGARSWEGVAISAQVPGVAPSPGEARTPVSFYVQTYSEYAILGMLSDYLRGVERVELRCGLAGAEGPVIWAAEPVVRNAGGRVRRSLPRIQPGDVVPTSGSADCGVTISTISSLKAAADDRLLYVQFERDGTVQRAQLWPRALGLMDEGLVSIAWASDEQVVDAPAATPPWTRSRAGLSFSEKQQSLDYAHVRIADRVLARYLYRSIDLYCGPAGVDGELLASLPPLEDRAVVSSENLVPTSATGPCGMVVNNVASLLEAVLRGNVYIVFESVTPAHEPLRGQFEHPGPGQGNSTMLMRWP